MTQPSSVTNFRAIQDCQKSTLAKHDNVSNKPQNFDCRNDMTCEGCACQKCSNHIFRKSFDFFVEHAGKIPLISLFYPSNRLFTKTVMESGKIFISRFLTSGIEPEPRGSYRSNWSLGQSGIKLPEIRNLEINISPDSIKILIMWTVTPSLVKVFHAAIYSVYPH
jgi:hypothetical protein